MFQFSRVISRLLGRAPDYEAYQPAASQPIAEPAPMRAYFPTYRLSRNDVQIAAIGDIHGRLDLLQKLERRIEQAASPDRRLVIVYIGDYVDHAGDAKAVLDHLIVQSARTDREVVCLTGNHEEMFLSALESDSYLVKWLKYGGDATMKAYGISPREATFNPAEGRAALVRAVPPEHVEFLRGLRPYYDAGEFFFVHAGLRPGKPFNEQRSMDMLWIREPFLSSMTNYGKVIVHGHTPTLEPDMRINRIGIDTGGYRTGVLSAVLISSTGVQLLNSAQAAPSALEHA
jgi:serine/threonine protein phosphatase 1